MNRHFRTFWGITLTAALLLVPAYGTYADTLAEGGTAEAVQTQNTEDITGKSEVIYGMLTAEGNVQAAYVVNHFEVASAGTLTDYGTYASVRNLSSTLPMQQIGDEVTADVEAGNFYYQGNMDSAELPWLIEVTYRLDGNSITPEKLAGKSGTLEIQIITSQNPAANPVYYENYVMQISVTLSSERCSNIQAADAQLAEAGKDRMLNFTILPGKDANVTVSAEVQDFEMVGIDISAVPYSMNIDTLDTSEMTDQFTELADAISSLDEGVGQLVDGIKDLNSGAGELKSGSEGIHQGLSTLSGNAGILTEASSQINIALTQISDAMGNGMTSDLDLDALGQLPDGLMQLADGLAQVSGGISQLKEGFVQAYDALDSAISQIPAPSITEEQLAGLYAATDPSQYGVLEQLQKNYAAAQTVRGTYQQVKAAFASVDGTLSALSGALDTMEDQLTGIAGQIGAGLSGLDSLSQLGELASGLAELSSNYQSFHKGLAAYTDGVKQLAGGYSDFNSGVSQFNSGVGELKDGAGELSDGTGQLNEETSKLPDTVQEEIDKMMEEYLGTDFAMVSFTSEKNQNVDLVQFVLKCGGIEKPEEIVVLQAEAEPEETFWDRVVALFQ